MAAGNFIRLRLQLLALGPGDLKLPSHLPKSASAKSPNADGTALANDREIEAEIVKQGRASSVDKFPANLD